MKVGDVIIRTAALLAEDLSLEHSRTAQAIAIKQAIAIHQARIIVEKNQAEAEAESDTGASSYIRITVADEAQAKKLSTTLQDLPGIEAAYIKPPVALP